MSQSNLANQFGKQLESIIKTFEEFKAKSRTDDLSDVVDEVAAQALITRSRASIARITGVESAYSKQVEGILNRPIENDWGKMAMIVEVVAALQSDLQSGYLVSIQELIHGDLFSDFLEMAEHLLGEGYKDPAAVLVGGVLEEHLRKLCGKNGIAIEYTNAKGKLRPKRAETMNTDLVANAVYSKLDQKNITAWLDLRNKAAHGHYSEYTTQQVELLLQSVRNFLTRLPA